MTMTDFNTFLDRIAISGTEYPHRPLKEVLDVAVRLGVKQLELWIPHNFAFEDLTEVDHQLTQRGLCAGVISTWTQLNLPGDVTQRQVLIRQSIAAAKALGARSVNTYFGAHASRSLEAAVQAYRDSIMPLVEYAEKEGVYITLENEFEPTGRDHTRKAEGVLRIVESIDSPFFKVNFDPCNFYFAGEEPYPYAYHLLKDYIGYVHLKDGMRFNPKIHAHPGEGFLWEDLSGKYICCSMGKGAINYEALLGEIRSSRYDGLLAFEPHVHPGHLFDTFQQSLEYVLQRLAGLD
jgi:sugar phosphate isomerase/epimerase